MPRTHLQAASSAVEAPLTVTAVSMRLGISPSTLRTWERRYGLGPGERRAGSHRRYLPADIARLAKMVDLVHAGVSPSDAAATVLSLADSPPAAEEPPAPHSIQDLVEVSCRCRSAQLRRVLEAAVSTEGLVHTWSRLVAPALERLRAVQDGELPGCAPSTVLRTAFLDLLAAVADSIPAHDGPEGSVAILTDLAHEVGAHVIGVALRWYGIDARVLASESIEGEAGSERFKRFHDAHPVTLAIVMGTGTSCERFISFLAEDCSLDVLLVGADAPVVVDGRVLRVRTPAACVEETLAVLAPGADLASFDA